MRVSTESLTRTGVRHNVTGRQIDMTAVWPKLTKPITARPVPPVKRSRSRLVPVGRWDIAFIVLVMTAAFVTGVGLSLGVTFDWPGFQPGRWVVTTTVLLASLLVGGLSWLLPRWVDVDVKTITGKFWALWATGGIAGSVFAGMFFITGFISPPSLPAEVHGAATLAAWIAWGSYTLLAMIASALGWIWARFLEPTAE